MPLISISWWHTVCYCITYLALRHPPPHRCEGHEYPLGDEKGQMDLLALRLGSNGVVVCPLGALSHCNLMGAPRLFSFGHSAEFKAAEVGYIDKFHSTYSLNKHKTLRLT